VINPADDVWVWASAALFLALMAARAWVVETGRTRLGRTSRQVKTLTGASAVVLVGLIALLGMQGGVLMVTSIVNGTDPSKAFYGPAPAAPAAPSPTTGG
jgi:hypothetical protein